MTDEAFEPNPLVHRPAMFVCHSDGCDIGYRERPEREVASGLLEEIGEWFRAMEGLTRTNVPGGVSAAMRALHEAACGWVDWLDRIDPVAAGRGRGHLPHPEWSET